MAQFTANQGGTFTPSVTTPGAGNYTVGPGTGGGAGTAGAMCKVKVINWGGSSTTSTGYRTRWVRSSTDPTGAGTALTLQKSNPIPVAICAVMSSFATTNPTNPADPTNLFAVNWNSLGGGGILNLPIGGEWFIVSSATAGTGYVQCINTAGTEANLSTYGVQFEE